MPYGKYGPLPLGAKPGCRPFVSSTVPLAWRLSPRQPGYVMTVCAAVSCSIERSAIAQLDLEGAIVV